MARVEWKAKAAWGMLMIAVLSMLSIFGGTCLACNARHTAYEKQAEALSGLLLIGGLGMIGAFLPIFR